MASESVGPRRANTLRCHTVSTGASRHLNFVRGLEPVTVAEWVGAPDEAPVASPCETMLVALGSCLGARIQANAASANIAVRSLELDVEVDLSAGSMWEPSGTTPSPVGFESIRVAVHMVANSSPEALRALIAHAVLWSPVANTLHDPVHLDVSLAIAADDADGPAGRQA